MADKNHRNAHKLTPHDGSYRRLFSHARMVEDLIRRYVTPPWLDRLDFSTLEQVPAHYVSDALEQRESDIVWRLRYRPGGEWFYVYLLIEFQSRVERFMAIRILAYVMLFYQNLIHQTRPARFGRLPPVLPIVLYNGERKWTAPLQMAELIESLPGFEALVPRFEYLVVDEGHLPREQLEPLDNPVSGIFQLEQSEGLAEIRRIIDTLIEVLDDPELRELRRDMTTWLRRAVLPARLPGVEVPEMDDLQEAKIMLAERAATWPQQWMAEGYKKGQAEGHKKGQAQGHKEGRKEGHTKGLHEALVELLQEKFGPIEERHAAMLAQASEEHLMGWLRRVLSARTAVDVFEA